MTKAQLFHYILAPGCNSLAGLSWQLFFVQSVMSTNNVFWLTDQKAHSTGVAGHVQALTVIRGRH